MMILLFDMDSVIYKACYKAVDIKLLKEAYRKHQQEIVDVNVNGLVKKQWKCRPIIDDLIIETCMDRLTSISDMILMNIDKDPFIIENGIDIVFVEYYITVGASIRKKLVPGYKANRKPKPQDKWVRIIRDNLLDTGFCTITPMWESDDLIYDRAKELGFAECIICSLDKDLKQIPGIHFNYYKRPWKESDGYNDFGYKNSIEMKGLTIVNEDQARYQFWTQMLTGDSVDNISGVKGIGKVKAEQILYPLFKKDAPDEDYEKIVKEFYNDKYGVEGEREYKKNYFLVKLGVRDLTELF